MDLSESRLSGASRISWVLCSGNQLASSALMKAHVVEPIHSLQPVTVATVYGFFEQATNDPGRTRPKRMGGLGIVGKGPSSRGWSPENVERSQSGIQGALDSLIIPRGIPPGSPSDKALAGGVYSHSGLYQGP